MRSLGISGKICLITGGAQGIGAAVVRALLAEGARVVATDLNDAPLHSLVQSVEADDSQLRAAILDVRDSNAVDDLVAGIERDWGPIEIGVNVAGVLSTTTVVDTSDEDWDRVFDVNVKGVFHVCRALARKMKDRRSGKIVTVSSNAAGIPRHSMAAYAASKAASTMFMRCLGLELGEYGIRCNIVAPGSTRTPMQEAMWADGVGPEAVIQGSLERFRTGIPLQRIADPEDIADAVLFLVSDLSKHITMTDLYVDGGATLRA